VNTLAALRAAVPTISVGILAADLCRLDEELHVLETAGVRLIHFDCMDGNFCPQMTFGPPVVRAVKTPLLKDVHLLANNPHTLAVQCVAAGADIVTLHIESDIHIHRLLQELGKMENANRPGEGIIRGVALNPGTPLEAAAPLLDEAEMLVVLAVNPGWGGQSFLRTTEKRLAQAIRLIASSGRNILLAVDGGVTKDNFTDVRHMGADIIVTGSAVFDGKDPPGNARRMLEELRGS